MVRVPVTNVPLTTVSFASSLANGDGLLLRWVDDNAQTYSPVPCTAVNTRIWIVGDCGRGTQIQASGRDAYYTPGFNGGYTGTRIPDLNLQMGDNAYNSGTDSEYQAGYFNMYANIFRKMPQWISFSSGTVIIMSAFSC